MSSVPGTVPTTPPADGPADRVAGRYRLVEVLGRGGTADVHRAVDEVLSREVAVKLLRDPAGSESDRQRFQHEIRTLAGFSHPALVMVLDGGTDERPAGPSAVGAAGAGHPFLVMELVDGPTLAAALRSGPLDLERAGAVGVQLADALAYVHGYDVVHRDVKPGNVLLGRDGRVKLADFGIARLIGDTVRHTRTGTAIGTAAYLSPEQVEGAEVTTASDVWSLGLVLLEALTGEQAYPGAPTEAALARLSRSPEVPADLPQPWRSVLTGALQRDPAQRPSAAEVAHALRASGPLPVVEAAPPDAHTTRVLPTTPPTTPPGTDHAGHRGRRTLELARAHPALLVVGALLALLIVVAGLVGASDGSAGPDGDGGVGDVPADVPPELEPLVRDLHDAVEEGAP